mmetsp:Transcript_6489/g.22335  ORF Transcript_6489/g.22335 Transcript_6489/m.22335 type:complete len:274 (-) Transcript_6489:1769-2590(-)
MLASYLGSARASSLAACFFSGGGASPPSFFSASSAALAPASASSSLRSALRMTTRPSTYSSRARSRSRNPRMASTSLEIGLRRLWGMIMMCITPCESPTAMYCCVVRCCQNAQLVSGCELMVATMLGSCDRSSRSQISSIPSCLARKITAARLGDQHPSEMYVSLQLLVNTGVCLSSCQMLKVQSPTLRSTLSKNGDRWMATTGPYCASATCLTKSGCSTPSGRSKSAHVTSPSWLVSRNLVPPAAAPLVMSPKANLMAPRSPPMSGLVREMA